MLIQAKKIKGYKLRSLTGSIGTVEDFYFDDKYWGVRYLVADTGNWLPGRKVLISPYSLGELLPESKDLVVNLTKDQISESPTLDRAKPVSRQFEESLYGHYGWPNYWSGTYMWGMYPVILRDRPTLPNIASEERTWDPNLRSTGEIAGYDIEAKDGEIGHVEDFLIDGETWAIRYLIIDTKNWWPGKKVLVSPQWIEDVNWTERRVVVNLTRDEIKESSEFNEENYVTRDFEKRLHQHYGRKGYWDENPRPIR